MMTRTEVFSLYGVKSVAWEGYGRWQKSDLGSREWGANTVQYTQNALDP
jgi:hypothetical protein